MSGEQSNDISKVAVIGAGTMGAAIAQHFLMKKLDVLLVDVQQEGLDKGLANIGNSLEEAVERRILTAEKKSALMGNLSCTTDYSKLSDRQFVVEAVFENMAVKQKVFQSIEQNVIDECIIASNTSSFSITELGSVLKNQKRFLGVHYFYHAAKNKLVELIPGKETSQDNVDRLTNFYYDNDKAPIVVADVYGFAVNRFFVPWLNEAVRLYEEGLGSKNYIDEQAIKLFNIGMGPFALMNATGVPIALHASRTLEENFGPMYSPAKLLVDQVESGQDWNLDRVEDILGNEGEVSKRLLAMSLGVAAQMVSEGVASITDTDLGARLGLRWPMGPFELMNLRGINQSKVIVEQVFEKYGHALPTIFNEIDSEKGFLIKHVDSHVVGNVGLLEFNRPDAMNALNPSVTQCLADAFDALENNPDIQKIILFGRGKAFVAGADIKYFVDNIKANTPDKIYAFTQFGQKLFSRIASSKKQTIAYLNGMALGGGLELALACQYRVATPRLMASFPETGIGIYPGLGGTQRTTRTVGKAVAKYLVATGAMVDAQTALKCGLVSKIVEPTNQLKKIAALSIDACVDPVASTTSEETIFENFDGEVNDALFASTDFQPYEKALRKKAPIALKTAMDLIDRGAQLPLEKALQLELDGLFDMFGSSDALAGLSGIILGKPAKFTGS